MNDNNLLADFALVGTQVVKLGAELFKPLPPNEACQARVELNLTPQPPEGPGAMQGGFVILARFGCVGLPASGREDERLFALEVVVNAAYRQERGDPIAFAEFQRHHISLTRQLFPLLQLHATRLLADLGLTQIRLPHDLLPNQAGANHVPPVLH